MVFTRKKVLKHIKNNLKVSVLERTRLTKVAFISCALYSSGLFFSKKCPPGFLIFIGAVGSAWSTLEGPLGKNDVSSFPIPHTPEPM